MKLEDMLKFSLGFMPKKPKSLMFFIPVFLLYVTSMVFGYFFIGVAPGYLSDLVRSAIESGDISTILFIPKIQTLLCFSLLTGILGWILNFYATICVYKSAELEYKKKKWDAKETIGKSTRILPEYLVLSIVVGVLLGISLVLVIGFLVILFGVSLVVIWFLGLFNSPIFGVIDLLVGVLSAILGTALTLYLGVRLSVASVTLVIENKGIMESLRRSWSLTNRSMVYILGCSILFLLITTVISTALGIISGTVAFFEGELLNISIISSILGYLITFYMTTAWAAFSYMIYLSLIERKKQK